MAPAAHRMVNPNYGSGVFRRRLHMSNGSPNHVHATLLDDYHDMRCILQHDGVQIRAIESEINRAPFSTCPGATVQINELVGMRLDVAARQFYEDGRPRRNCTHLFDLAIRAVTHAISGQPYTTLNFIVPDVLATGSPVEAWRNGELVHRWMINDHEVIIAPEAFAGRALFGGFSKWAAGQFSGDALELALHLQKIVLVARSRKYRTGGENRRSIRDQSERIGVCYSFSEPQFSIAATNPDSVRDFTNGLPDALSGDA